MTEPDPLFEVLDPPPGGLASLRARVERDVRRRARRRQVGFSVAVAALVAATAAGTVYRRARIDSLPPELASLQRHLALVDLPREPVTVPDGRRADTAVRRVPLPTDRVVFYFIGHTGRSPILEAPSPEGEGFIRD